MTKLIRIHTIIGLFICYIGVTFLAKSIHAIYPFDTFQGRTLLSLCCSIFLAAALLFHVFFIEKRDFKSIGWKPFDPSRDIKWGMIGFGIGGMCFGLTAPILEAMDLGTTEGGIVKLGTFPIWLRIVISLVAGTTEEILLRTYPIERLKEWTGNIWFAAVISILLFAGLHLPFWSLGGAIQIGLATIVWTLIYVKTRSLWAVIIMHILNDLFAFVLLPYFFI